MTGFFRSCWLLVVELDLPAALLDGCHFDLPLSLRIVSTAAWLRWATWHDP